MTWLPARSIVAAWMITIGLVGPLAVSAAGLVAPVDVEGQRARFGRPVADFVCPTSPAPIRDLDLVPYYADAANSIVDPVKLDRYQRSAKPVAAFLHSVTSLSDDWLRSAPADPAIASCALRWLDHWAADDALLGRIAIPDGEHHRRWDLAGLALAYLKTRDAPGLDPAAKQRVTAWFRAVADAATAYYDTWRPASANNHITWYGLALAATAVATDDRALFAKAMAIYDATLGRIDADGALPIEMERRGRALHYHIFTALPLVLLAEFGAVNGLPSYDAQDGALARLIARITDGLADPAWFVRRTGTAQDLGSDGTRAWTLAWAEIWLRRHPDPSLEALLASVRPIRQDWLGGDMTLDFARR